VRRFKLAAGRVAVNGRGNLGLRGKKPGADGHRCGIRGSILIKNGPNELGISYIEAWGGFGETWKENAQALRTRAPHRAKEMTERRKTRRPNQRQEKEREGADRKYCYNKH